MASMTEKEQVQLARELVESTPEEIEQARRDALRMWQSASSSAEMKRGTTTLRMYEGLQILRNNIAKLEA